MSRCFDGLGVLLTLIPATSPSSNVTVARPVRTVQFVQMPSRIFWLTTRPLGSWGPLASLVDGLTVLFAFPGLVTFLFCAFQPRLSFMSILESKTIVAYLHRRDFKRSPSRGGALRIWSELRFCWYNGEGFDRRCANGTISWDCLSPIESRNRSKRREQKRW